MQRIESLVAAFAVDSGIADAVNRKSAGVIAQFQAGVAALPETLGAVPAAATAPADDSLSGADGDQPTVAAVSPSGSRVTAIDDWFAKHFKAAPIAHDTEIYNRLHAAVESLKAQVIAH